MIENDMNDTVSFNTVTEALNYDGDKATVKKLIITGTISGSSMMSGDYYEDSEWTKFRTLDETFPNIEEVEILTDQDIPDFNIQVDCGLFWWKKYKNNEDFGSDMSSKWLKKFSAPNVKYIGERAFYACGNLTSINLPLVKTIKDRAFSGCENLMSINLPLVRTIKNYAFRDCKKLISAIWGTGFRTEKKIEFEWEVFGYNDDNCDDNKIPILTPNIDLILGKNVLPKPDLTENTWQTYYGNPYTWKSITVKTDETEK